MPNPWDLKMVHQLSESEMLDYVHHLQVEDAFNQAEDLEKTIENVVHHWRKLQERAGQRMHASDGYMHIQLSPQGTYWSSGPYAGAQTYEERCIRIFVWMQEQEVRYLAREQLLEFQNAERPA